LNHVTTTFFLSPFCGIQWCIGSICEEGYSEFWGQSLHCSEMGGGAMLQTPDPWKMDMPYNLNYFLCLNA